jgi:hypothetical protein
MRAILGFLFSAATFLTTLQAQCLEGDCQNGRGVMLYQDGTKYAGDFRKGVPHGKGEVAIANGGSYRGDWVAGGREGVGVYRRPTGEVYTGSFKKNKQSGRGVMTYPNGNKYEGNWENDLPNGYGKYTFPATGEWYEGVFVNGLPNGMGVMAYKDGDKYVGEWRDNKRHGRGKINKKDGRVVDVVFENGRLVSENGVPMGSDGKPLVSTTKPNASNTEGGTATTPNPPATVPSNEFSRNCNREYCGGGKGTFTYGDGSRWVGEFKDGIPEGQGTCYYADGNKYVGKFEKHAPNGEGTMYRSDGRIVTAIWEYGRPVGEVPSNSQVAQTPVEVDRNTDVKIWAVVVGVGRYSSMPVLKYSDDDAYQYYAFLKSPEGGALPDQQVKVLVDEDATRANILQTCRQILLRADENDVIVFYFSGHGLDGYFLPQDYDGINNRLLHSDIKAIFEQSKAKHKLVVADACFSGSMLAMKQPFTMQQMQGFYRAFENSSGGMALLMSSKSQEYSLEDQGLRSGIFSHYLIRGLKGEADVDGNRIVTVREIYDFVFKNVRSYTSNAQTPTISGKFASDMPISFVRQ